VAKLEDFVVGFRVDRSFIEGRILAKTIDNAFDAADDFLIDDPKASSARVIQANGGACIELIHDDHGLFYVEIENGSTRESIVRRILDVVGNGNR
jgi:hypothetical protein